MRRKKGDERSARERAIKCGAGRETGVYLYFPIRKLVAMTSFPTRRDTSKFIASWSFCILTSNHDDPPAHAALHPPTLLYLSLLMRLGLLTSREAILHKYTQSIRDDMVLPTATHDGNNDSTSLLLSIQHKRLGLLISIMSLISPPHRPFAPVLWKTRPSPGTFMSVQ